MAAHVLAPIASMNTALLTTLVHPTLFPYSLVSSIHALRISLVHRALTKRGQDAAKPSERTKQTWAYDVVGFLIMCWGGGFITNFMLGQPPVQLLSTQLLVNHLSVHLVVTFILQYTSAPVAKLLDTTFIFVDASTRIHAVILSVGLTATHSNPAIRDSLLLQVVLGTIGATGGGQLAGMLGIHSAQGWSLHTPPCLRATHLVEVIDIILAFICSIVFGLTTLSHPAYIPILAYVYGNEGKPLLSPLGARAACTLIFAAGFAYRAIVLHWMPATTAVGATKSGMQQKINGTKR